MQVSAQWEMSQWIDSGDIMRFTMPKLCVIKRCEVNLY